MIMEFAWAIDDAIEIISDPEKWTHEAAARDKYEYVVPVDSPEACKWCASGALSLAFNDRGIETCLLNDGNDTLTAREKEVLTRGIGGLAVINDKDGREAAISHLKHIRHNLLCASNIDDLISKATKWNG